MTASSETLHDLKAIVWSTIRAGIWATFFGVSLHLSSLWTAAIPVFLLFLGTQHLSREVNRLRNDNFKLRIAIANYLIAKQADDLAQLSQGELDIGNKHKTDTKATSDIDAESFAG
ncbi:MAG: hypothetical protein ACW96N_00070 [Candidatus Thorarchaeota archaeon]